MTESLCYQDWYDKALEDLKGALVLLDHQGGNDQVAAQSRESMEKHLKGWLLKETGELVEEKSLVYLCRKAIRAGGPFEYHLLACTYVNQLCDETRYPTDAYIPLSDKEAAECFEFACRIHNTIEGREIVKTD